MKPFGPIANILLVEDDHDDIQVFTDVLKAITHNVVLTTIEDGGLALKLLKEGEYSPDCIFLDLKLPGSDGLQILTEIRREQSLAGVPIFIYSAIENELIVQSCKELRIEEFIFKSVDLTQLASALRRCTNITFSQ